MPTIHPRYECILFSIQRIRCVIFLTLDDSQSSRIGGGSLQIVLEGNSAIEILVVAYGNLNVFTLNDPSTEIYKNGGVTNLQKKVLDLEKTKTTQANEIASLKRRVMKLEKKGSSRTHKLKRLYKVGLSARVESSRDEDSLGEDASKQGRRINAIDADEDITLNKKLLLKMNLTVDEVTLAQALTALKSVKPKVKGDVIEEPSVPVSAASASKKVSAATTTTAIIPTPRKGIVITELGTPTIMRSSQQLSQTKDDILAKIEADRELAQRLRAEEQEELSVEEKAKLFQQLLEKKKKALCC
ncbi:hypothetical protein Tco_0722745 [Tanacetum coccineum]